MANTARRRKRTSEGRFASETGPSSSLRKPAKRGRNGGSPATAGLRAEPPASDSEAADDLHLQAAQGRDAATHNHESQPEAPSVVHTPPALEQGVERKRKNGVSRDRTSVEELMQIPSFRARVIARLVKRLG